VAQHAFPVSWNPANQQTKPHPDIIWFFVREKKIRQQSNPGFAGNSISGLTSAAAV
jgi:hypothetical protein